MSDLIDLAKTLTAWVPKSAGNPVSYQQLQRMVTSTNIPTFTRTNSEIGRLLDLFRHASPEERTAARRIIYQGEPKPVWILLRGWQSTETDPAERLRWRVTKYAFNHGNEDYRDEALAMNDIYQEAARQGLDSNALRAEYTTLYADYTPDLITFPAHPEISESAASYELAGLDEALREYPNSAAHRYERGIIYMKLHQFEKAVEDFAVALKNNHQTVDSHYQSGRANAALGRVKPAYQHFVSALAQDNAHPHTDEMRNCIQRWRDLV